MAKKRKKKNAKKINDRRSKKRAKKMKHHPFGAGFLDMKKLGLQEPEAIRQMRKMNEMAESLLKPYRDHERMMRNMLEPYERTRKMFEDPLGIRMLRRQMTIASEFEKVLAPYRQQQSTIDQMLRSFQPRTGVFEEVMNAVLQPSATLTFLADAEKILKTFRIEKVTTSGVTINGEEISFGEAEDELAEAWSTTTALPPEERVAATSRRFAQSKQPPLLLVLLAFILGAMFESPIQTISDPALVPRANQVLKWLEVNVPSVWATTATPQIRSVTKEALELRLLPKRSSTKLGALHEGDRVEVLEKRKDWTLVVSVEDENVGGWVFSRYLKRVAESEVE